MLVGSIENFVGIGLPINAPLEQIKKFTDSNELSVMLFRMKTIYTKISLASSHCIF